MDPRRETGGSGWRRGARLGAALLLVGAVILLAARLPGSASPRLFAALLVGAGLGLLALAPRPGAALADRPAATGADQASGTSASISPSAATASDPG